MLECASVIRAFLGSASVLGPPQPVEVAGHGVLPGAARALGQFARFGTGGGAVWLASMVAMLPIWAFVGIMACLLAYVASDVGQIWPGGWQSSVASVFAFAIRD